VKQHLVNWSKKPTVIRPLGLVQVHLSIDTQNNSPNNRIYLPFLHRYTVDWHIGYIDAGNVSIELTLLERD
jgi:hypothetical protein